MSRIHISLTDKAENIIAEKFGTSKKGISKYIENLIIEDYNDTKEKEEKQLNVIKKIVRDTDNNFQIFMAAFNTFLLNFAPEDSQNLQPIADNPHTWIEQATEQQKEKVKEQYKKWGGY